MSKKLTKELNRISQGLKKAAPPKMRPPEYSAVDIHDKLEEMVEKLASVTIFFNFADFGKMSRTGQPNWRAFADEAAKIGLQIDKLFTKAERLLRKAPKG